MRIWDIHPIYLCRKHLLSEHRELHGLWNILTIHKGMGGYSHHPETKRWVGKIAALYTRHELLVAELIRRGYRHLTPLNHEYISGESRQSVYITPISEQILLLKRKGCECHFV